MATAANAVSTADVPKPVQPPVTLPQAATAVRTTVELAARQGLTEARIQLSPPELGGIRITLRQTSDGLVARVVADHPAAAAALQQAGAELRRSLASAGVNLLHLDIEGSDERTQAGRNSGQESAAARSDADAADEEPGAPGLEALAASASGPPGAGDRVDVLA